MKKYDQGVRALAVHLLHNIINDEKRDLKTELESVIQDLDIEEAKLFEVLRHHQTDADIPD